MQAIIIDLNQAEAYLALPDGTNINMAITHLPNNIKIGGKVNLNPSNSMMTNCRTTSFL